MKPEPLIFDDAADDVAEAEAICADAGPMPPQRLRSAATFLSVEPAD